MSIIGYAEYPGIDTITAASGSLSHGISPNVLSITTAPQPSFAAKDGDLVLTAGAVKIVWKDCRIDKASLQYSATGATIGFSLLDRRWKWKFGEISGIWNTRLATDAIGSLNETTEKAPQELAGMCLDAMNEFGYDVSRLPNENRPPVNWDSDNPAQALANLADSLGCRVVLRLNNTVAIVKTGEGAKLPTDGATADSAIIDPPDAPDSIKLVGGPSRYQIDVLLEAVGLDVDNEIKPIGKLSYKPAGGWEKETALTFPGVADKKAKKLAFQTLYRWYRIAPKPLGADGKTLTIPGFGKVLDVQQMLLDNEQILVSESLERVMMPGGILAEKRVKRPLPTFVFGYYNPKTQKTGSYSDNVSGEGNRAHDGNLPQWTADGAEVMIGYSLNALQYRVEFSDRVLRYSELADKSFNYVPALLCLRTAVTMRDTKTRVMRRFKMSRETGERSGTGAKIIKREEIVLQHFPVYGHTTNKPHTVKTNENDVLIDADGVGADGQKINKTVQFDSVTIEAGHYLDAAEQAYQAKNPQTFTYHGLVAIELDGAIQQVAWSVNSSGHPTTTASRNEESDVLDVPYSERRFHEKFWGGKLDQMQRQLAEQHQPDWFRKANR